jgi:hypothetical protein
MTKHPSNASVDALAEIIWLAGFERAFDRTPTDPWGNQSDDIKNTHRDTARKIIAAGYTLGNAQPPAKPISRQWIIDLIRNQFDPAPAHYRPGDNWDDGAEAIADVILSQSLAPAQQPLDREQLAALLYVTRWPHQTWTTAGLDETAHAYRQADAVLSLLVPSTPG